MSVVNKFIDSENFATAISVYDDVNLLIKSPDGFYQFNGIYREQVGGFLSPEVICPTCALPCGEIAGESSDIRGTFLAEISGGTDVGAVIVYSIVGSEIPDGVLDCDHQFSEVDPEKSEEKARDFFANIQSMLGD